jgi:hypothetical protein
MHALRSFSSYSISSQENHPPHNYYSQMVNNSAASEAGFANKRD